MNKKLKQARLLARLTQAELAKLSGVRQATISSIENGHPYRSTTIEKIEEVLTRRGIIL